jgi:hypothetical protein
MCGVPFLSGCGLVESFDPSEALVYPLHPDQSHPLVPDLGYLVLVVWNGRWIRSLVAAGDLVGPLPTPADSPTFHLYRNAEEIDAVAARRLLCANGYDVSAFEPPPSEAAASRPAPADPIVADASRAANISEDEAPAATTPSPAVVPTEASGATPGKPDEEKRKLLEHAADHVSVTIEPEPTVILEGVTYSVTTEQAEVVAMIYERRPAPVTYKTMVKDSPLLKDQDPAKIGRDILDKLPDPIQSRIERKPGKGCTWIN